MFVVVVVVAAVVVVAVAKAVQRLAVGVILLGARTTIQNGHTFSTSHTVPVIQEYIFVNACRCGRHMSLFGCTCNA